MTSRRWGGFRSVLCSIDFSDQSGRALQFAAAIARRGNAVLRVLYVNDPLLVASAAAALHDRQLTRQSAKELQTFIRATLSSRAGGRPRITPFVTIGTPADQILKAASQHASDLIVLGTHGLTGAHRLIMGSTTLSVLQRATVPVLAIPGGNDPPTTAVSPSWPGRQILAAIDLEGALKSEAESAARIAQWFGSTLLLAHVVSTIAAPAWMAAALSASERIRVAQAQRKLEALAAVARRHVETDVRLTCGDVADEIAALAAGGRTQLLLTALHDRRRWLGAKRGSISYHVLSHAVAPVLAYPPLWQPR